MATTPVRVFVDEYGDSGLHTEKSGVTAFFILTAVFVPADAYEQARVDAEVIRERHFQTGEMKSSKIGDDDVRRARVLADLCQLPITTFSVAVDKREIHKGSGLAFKPSFFKYLNNLLYRKIYEAHPTAAVVADEHGKERFMAGFQTYLQKHRSGQGDLFRNFTFENSKREVLLQVADVLAGSLARAIDPKKKSPRALEFLQALRSQANGIEIWPPKYARAFQHDQATTDFDLLVKEQCAGRAELFIERMERRQSLDEVERAQLEVLRLLLFTSKFGDEGAFVSTYQLIKHLRAERLDLSTHQIRSSVVAKLRDSDVIVASGKKGYKLPVVLSDVLEFVGQAQTMVPPMLSRLSRARTALSVASLGQLDILAAAEFDELRRLIDTSQIPV